MVKFQISPECQTTDTNSPLYLYMDSAGNISVQTTPLSTWTLFDTGGGNDLLVCTEYNKAVTIDSINGAIATLKGVSYDTNIDAKELWKAIPKDNGYYCFQSQYNQSFNINVEGNTYENNTTVIAYGNWHNRPNERWKLIPVA